MSKMSRLTRRCVEKPYATRLYGAIDKACNDIVYLEGVYNKLGKLEDLEVQLGCPLEVVFKAREGIYTNVGYISPEHIYNIDIKNQTIEFEWLAEDGYWNEEGLVEFENYKKNWWLKEDRSE